VLPIKCFANDFFCRLSSSAVDHAERSCPSAESVAGHLDQTRYDGHFESIWYHPHPLLRLNREGECLAARLRPGNVHSADGWEELLLPEIERHQTLNKEVVFRGDAAFAKPKLYEALEERREDSDSRSCQRPPAAEDYGVVDAAGGLCAQHPARLCVCKQNSLWRESESGFKKEIFV
jgi:hypothetical protein